MLFLSRNLILNVRSIEKTYETKIKVMLFSSKKLEIKSAEIVEFKLYKNGYKL